MYKSTRVFIGTHRCLSQIASLWLNCMLLGFAGSWMDRDDVELSLIIVLFWRLLY